MSEVIVTIMESDLGHIDYLLARIRTINSLLTCADGAPLLSELYHEAITPMPGTSCREAQSFSRMPLTASSGHS
jgi:hypothetical protein